MNTAFPDPREISDLTGGFRSSPPLGFPASLRSAGTLPESLQTLWPAQAKRNRRARLWRQVRRLFVRELAIDLGTANTLIYRRGRGLVVSEPSTIAVHRYTGAVVAVGREALAMLGREPRDVVVRYPMRDGTIADDDLAEKMLRAFLKRTCAQGFGSRTHLLIGVPSSATDVERTALREIAQQVGADRVRLVEEGLAAALGVGLPLHDGRAHMIVDIGGGTTSISIVSAHGLIRAQALRVAGNEMTDAILEHFRQERDVLLGYQAAEEVKRELASALPFLPEERKRILGKSAITREVVEIEVTSSEVSRAIERPLQIIANAVRAVLEEAPPDAAADIHQTGIVLTGGGSLIRHLDERLREELRLPVRRAERPLEAVLCGMARLIENPEWFDQFRPDARAPFWEETVLSEDARPSSAIALSPWMEERTGRRRAARS